MVADKHRQALVAWFLVISTSMALNDLEPKNELLVIFWRFSATEE